MDWRFALLTLAVLFGARERQLRRQLASAEQTIDRACAALSYQQDVIKWLARAFCDDPPEQDHAPAPN